MFSGGSISTNEITDMDAFKQKVKLVFVSYGSREVTEPGMGANGRPTPSTANKPVSIVFTTNPR